MVVGPVDRADINEVIGVASETVPGNAVSCAGGGAGRIGVRGPGEKKLETDRRRIRDRVSKIQKSIEDVRKQRALRRDHPSHRRPVAVRLAGVRVVLSDVRGHELLQDRGGDEATR